MCKDLEFGVACSLCGKEIRWSVCPTAPHWHVDKEIRYRGSVTHGIIYGGEAGWYTLGYGSNFDGERWLLVFCDKCLESFKPAKIESYLPDHNRRYYTGPKMQSKLSLPR